MKLKPLSVFSQFNYWNVKDFTNYGENDFYYIEIFTESNTFKNCLTWKKLITIIRFEGGAETIICKDGRGIKKIDDVYKEYSGYNIVKADKNYDDLLYGKDKTNREMANFILKSLIK